MDREWERVVMSEIYDAKTDKMLAVRILGKYPGNMHVHAGARSER